MIACFAWGLLAVVSHRAAAALWCLAGFESISVELTVPRGRRRTGPGIIHHNALTPAEITVLDGIPVTTPTRTLLDVASVAHRDRVEEALDDALRRRLVTLPRLRWSLAEWERSRRAGVAVLRELVAARDGTGSVPQSVFETRLLRVIERASLPAPVRQFEVWHQGRLVAVPDYAFPKALLGIEADSYRWHSGRASWEHDRARRNRLTLLGWRIIHITWTELTRRPDLVVDSIRLALGDSRPTA